MSKTITKTCVYCQKLFEAEIKLIKYAQKHGKQAGIYCSKICASAAKIQRIDVECSNCKKLLSKLPREIKESKNGVVFCNNSCAATFTNKIRKSQKTLPCADCQIECIVGINTLEVNSVCDSCWKIRRNDKENSRVFNCIICQKLCRGKGKYCEICLSKRRSLAGQKSAEVRKDIKRSKNEIYFYELCKNFFSNISPNERLFDGWDADVLLKDLKIAVLWNGAFHYQECGGSHSLKQVQTRDKIKISKIIEFGWTPYIIKDLGRYNPKFVEEKFAEFILNCYLQTINKNTTNYY